MKTMVRTRTIARSILLATGAVGAAALLTACSSGGVTERAGTSDATTARTSPPPVQTPSASPSGAPSQAPSGDGTSLSATASTTQKSFEIPDPAVARASYREGAALYGKGDYKAAVPALRTAALGRPDHAYTHYLLGLALWKSGQASEAEASLERSGEIDPTFDKTWINLGRVRMELGDAAGALDASGKALGIHDGSPSALHVRGRALAALGRNDEALDALERAHEGDPENGWISNTLGLELINVGRESEAVPVLEQARDRLPNVAFVRNNLGVACERTGQVEQAVQEYVAAVQAGDAGGKAAASLTRLEPVLTRMIAEGRVSPQSESPALARSVPQGDADGSAGAPKQ